MTEPKYLIWSNYSLDYEDWREDLEAEYPELSEQEREEKMYERNSEYLDDERMNLDIQLDKPILVIVVSASGMDDTAVTRKSRAAISRTPVLGVRLCNLVC